MQVTTMCGQVQELKAGAATMGLQLQAVTLKSDDLLMLLDMEDKELRSWLSALRTRFGPKEPQDA